jgi:hypothetical protein
MLMPIEYTVQLGGRVTLDGIILDNVGTKSEFMFSFGGNDTETYLNISYRVANPFLNGVYHVAYHERISEKDQGKTFDLDDYLGNKHMLKILKVDTARNNGHRPNITIEHWEG